MVCDWSRMNFDSPRVEASGVRPYKDKVHTASF
jgi:hypothetical protein